MRKLGWMAVAAGGLALAACSVSQEKDADATSNGAPDNGETAGVVRQEAPPPPPLPVQLTPAPIQSQPGPEGRSVDLLRASVAGDIMSVALTYRAAPGTRTNGRNWHNPSHFKVDEVSVIGDATAKRLGVLKDDRGQWMAAPLSSGTDGRIMIDGGDQDEQVWFKFPAPSPETKTVSINIPKVGPFDAVPVTR